MLLLHDVTLGNEGISKWAVTVYYKVVPFHDHMHLRKGLGFFMIKIKWNGYERALGVIVFNHVLRDNK